MSSLFLPASRLAGHRAMAGIEARRMARSPVFVVGVVLGFAVIGLYAALTTQDYLPVVLTLPLLGAFYIGLTSIIAAARLTRSTEVADEAVATAPGTQARRTLALAATGLPPFAAGLVFTGVVLAEARVVGVPAQDWWFGTMPAWQVWSILLLCPVACLDGALLGVLTGRWLRFRGAAAVVVVAVIVVSLLGQGPFLGTSRSEWRLWVPWAMFHLGDNPDGTETLLAGNPAAYLGYLLGLGGLALLGAVWRDRTARTPRLRALVVAVATATLALFALAVATGNHDDRISDPIPALVQR